MELPERREAGGRVRLRWGDQDERERADKVDKDPTAEGFTEEEFPPEDAPQEESGAEVKDPDEIRRQLEAKDQYIQELHEELAVARVTADEVRSRAEAGELRVRKLEEDRGQLREKVRKFEEEERGRRRRREGQDRRGGGGGRRLQHPGKDILHPEELLSDEEEGAAA